MQKVGRSVVGTMFAAALAFSPAQADVKAGVDAWYAKDYTAAVNEWRPFAEKGDPDAQFNLGQAYKLGNGVPKDLAIAQSWFQRAAQQGHAEAQGNLGLLLYDAGKRQEAMPWIQKSAEYGDPRAQYVLGIELNNGDLLSRDWPRAYALMTLASAQGVKPASESLVQMDQFLPQADREKGLAMAHQMKARGQASPDAPAAQAARPAQPIQSAPPIRVASNEAPAVSAAPRRATPAPPSLPRTPVQVPAAPAKPAAPAPKPAPAVAKAPAPKPAAAPAKTAFASAGGRWRVQLGAYGSPQGARGQWATLSKRINALSGLTASYEPAGALTRLRVGPLADRAAADRLCNAAKAAGQACFPVAP